MAKSPAAATIAWLRSESERVAQACTACGRCVTACPMTAYAPEVATAEPPDVVRGVLDLLRAAPCARTHALKRGSTRRS
jgi:ferredoxin